MKKLLEYFIDRSLIVNTLTVAVCVVGFLTFSQMSRDLIPTLESKTVRIDGRLPGASAVDVERFLTFPIEEAVRDLTGIQHIRSTTKSGEFRINVIFKPEHDDIARSLETIRSRVAGLQHRFPSDLEPLTIRHVQQDRVDFVDVIVEPIDDQDPDDRKWLESLAEQLDDIPHVIAVDTSLPKQDLYVEFSREAIDAAGLDVRDVVRRVREALAYEPIGRVRTDEEIIAVALDKGIDREGAGVVDRLAKLPITRNRVGEGLDLEDVATISLESEARRVEKRHDGQRYVTLELWKDTDSDIIQLEARVAEEIAEFNQRAPDRFEARIQASAAYLIEQPLSVILTNGLAGLGIVGLVLFVFLGFRTAAMAVIGLPFVYLGTFIVLDAFGVQIHLISVIGLLLVLGILVDDAILVAERFLEKLQEGMTPREAAVESAYTLLRPVSGTIVTNIVVFAPILFIESEMSAVFFAIPIVMIGTLLLSLFESFFLLPNHLMHFVPPGYRFEERRVFVWMQNGYRRLLKWALKLRYVSVLAFLALLVASIFILQDMEKSFNISLGTKRVFVHGVVAEPKSIDDSLAQGARLEAAVKKLLPAEDYEWIYLTAGEATTAGGHALRGKKHVELEIAVDAHVDDPNALAEAVAEELTTELAGFEGFESVEVHRRHADPSKKDDVVTIYVSGGDTLSFEEIQEAIRTTVTDLENVERVFMDPNRFQPAWQFEPNAEVMERYGVDTAALTQQLRNTFAPQELLKMRYRGDEITVYTRFAREGDWVADELDAITVVTPRGLAVPLSTIGRWRQTRVLQDIRHLDLLRKFEIDVAYDKSKIDTDAIQASLDERLGALRAKYPQYQITVEPPEAEEEAKKWVTKVIALCVCIIFLALVFVLGSLSQPLFVMFSIPFGVTGVVLALAAHGMPLSMMAIIGLVGLAGVVVNDSLVMVDTINTNRRSGIDARTSIETGAASRFKAVVLTSLTTLGGVFPLAYGIGGKAGFAQPMVFALGWGLLFATALTLVLLPCTLAIFDDVGRGLRWLRRILPGDN
ncbi:MAG: efflux RND transporter permease subunit [Deltaproteobacteria bacterium]